ncbi:MAG: mevalonate kinase, partial [Promethearchaeota archaeon]
TMDRLKSPKKSPLVIANTGITTSTTQVVGDVKRLKEENPKKFQIIFDKYKNLATKAKNALLKADINIIGDLMNQNHKLLQEITVSGEINNRLVDLCLNNGAIGAKMTGTGRGGLVIALADTETLQEKIYNAVEKEGYEAWKTMIG